jgi:type IV pilus assembly protein PilC
MVVNLLNTNTTEASKTSIMQKIDLFFMNISRVPASEKLFFVQHLGVMLKAGVSIVTSLRTLAKQSKNKKFIQILNDIANNVEKGTSLADSLKLHEKIFGELFINMIEAGEVSGKLESVMGQLFIQLKKQHAIMSKVKGAMTYPVVILVAVFGIGAFMMVFVVPKITSMLKDFGADLPLATRVLIGTSDFIVNHGIIVSIGLIVFFYSAIKINKTYRGKWIIQSVLLKLPVFGEIIKKINLARFSRTISSLLKTDIMIIKSFQITANTLGNLHYKKALNETAEKIKKGTAINEVIATYADLFPPLVTQMVAIGEQTGELDDILGELAEFYEEEVDQVMTNLPSIIEPILILVMGGVVGGMAIAIIMPMYSLSSAV